MRTAWSDPDRWVVWLGCSLLALSGPACSSVADPQSAASGGDGSDSQGLPDEGPAGDDEGDDGDEAGEDPGGDTGGGEDGGETGEDRPPPPGADGMFGPCPEAWPDAWVLCEDFESIEDPMEIALDYQALEGAFVLVDDVGASGERSMEITHREGEEGAGWLVLSFGSSPIAVGDQPTHAADEDFPEIYWRLRVMTEPGWPDVGPGQLTRTVAFAGSDWTEAVVAQLRSTPDDVTLEAVAGSCVTGVEIACNGYDDQAAVESTLPLTGRTRLFGEEQSGDWHCVEGHLALNTPGLADGRLEFWVDDELQASRGDLDLRGSWSEYGINALVIENFWPGGAPQKLRRWVDDVVVSTEPVGCEDDPVDASAG